MAKWWQSRSKEERYKNAEPGPTIGGGPLSISRAIQEWKAQETVKLDMAGPSSSAELTDAEIMDYIAMGYTAVIDGEGEKWLIHPDSPNYAQTMNYLRKHKGGVRPWVTMSRGGFYDDDW